MQRPVEQPLFGSAKPSAAVQCCQNRIVKLDQMLHCQLRPVGKTSLKWLCGRLKAAVQHLTKVLREKTAPSGGYTGPTESHCWMPYFMVLTQSIT